MVIYVLNMLDEYNRLGDMKEICTHA